MSASELNNDNSNSLSSPELVAFNNLSLDIRLQILQFYNETRNFERKVGIVIPSIFAVVIVVGLVGNLLVIAVALNRQMRNSTNTLIIGLACSDLMFLTLCVPFTAIDYAFPVWVFPTWTCNMINYLQHVSAYFSVWTLTLMAADRFLAVGRIHGVYNYIFVIENRSACSIISIAKGKATVTEARIYFFSFNIFGYLIPLGITCILYYFMLKRLWHAPKPNSETGNDGSISGSSSSYKNNIIKKTSSSLRCRPETIRAKRKVTRLVMCVVVIWALCWFPLNICFFISGLVYPDTLVLKGGKPIIIAQISSQVLAYTNSCLNPILYSLVSDNFRKGFLRIICITLNWCTFGRFCKHYRDFRLNSRIEVTFYNEGSRSRSSTNRMSRTNSCHRHNTKTLSSMNDQAFKSSSHLLHSFLKSNNESSPGIRNITTSYPPKGALHCLMQSHRHFQTEISTVSLTIFESKPFKQRHSKLQNQGL